MRKILARVLVLCMLLGVMSVPAFAADMTVAQMFSSDTTYELTADTTTLSGSIAQGVYTINANGKKLTVSSVTVGSGASLGVYNTDGATNLLFSASNATVNLNNVYDQGGGVYTIGGSVTLNGPGGTFKYRTNLGTVSVANGSDPSTDGGYTTYTYRYPGGGGGGGAATPTTTPSTSTSDAGDVTVPLSTTNSTSGDTVTVSASTAAVTAAVTAAENSGDATPTVLVDVSNAGADVVSATLPAAAVTAAAEADKAVALEVAMPAGNVTLDAATLEAVAAVAGSDVTLTLETTTSTASLAEAQQETLEGLATAATISASLESKGQAISDFGGGTVTVSVPFTAPAANRPANKFGVYFLSLIGNLTRQPTSYANGKLSFSTTHFSDFVAVYEPFADVTADKWYAQYALYASDNGIMNGMENGFQGDVNLSRAMMVQTLYNIKGKPAAGSSDAFADVQNEWFAPAVNWASANHVANGAYGYFNPDDAMTREQMAQFLYNYAKAEGKDVSGAASLSGYSDASSVSSWATAAMAWAVNEGYITGMDGKLNPQGTATRAQVAAVLTRFAQA